MRTPEPAGRSARLRAISVPLVRGTVIVVPLALGVHVSIDGPGDGVVSAPHLVCWRSQILQPSECFSGGTGFGTVFEVCRAAVASAVVGCVGGPVSGGGSLPGDSDADVDAEQPGQQGRGELGGEAEQRGRACRAGAELELAQSPGQAAGADWLAGLSAGEQPAGASLVAQCGVSAAGGGELEDEGVEWPRQHDGVPAEPGPHRLLPRVETIRGQAGGPGRGIWAYREKHDTAAA